MIECLRSSESQQRHQYPNQLRIRCKQETAKPWPSLKNQHIDCSALRAITVLEPLLISTFIITHHLSLMLSTTRITTSTSPVTSQPSQQHSTQSPHFSPYHQ
ncbi:hypothetical protein M758_2G096900 [Ceratodon purpureus]|nr:hypothetical protein M758_2G096900 [Ceratodon purpureus]